MCSLIAWHSFHHARAARGQIYARCPHQCFFLTLVARIQTPFHPPREAGHDFTRQGSPRNQQTCTAPRADAPGSALKRWQLTLFYPFGELCCGQEPSLVSKAERSPWHSGNQFKPPQNSMAKSPRLHGRMNSAHFHEILLIPTPPSNVRADLGPVVLQDVVLRGRKRLWHAPQRRG